MGYSKTYSIAELAENFGVTKRTIRCYEEIGLLTPKRTESGRRIFTRKEWTRMLLILRGKNMVFNSMKLKK